jgi:hypothetical protein
VITNAFWFLKTVIDLGTIGPVFSLPSRSREPPPDEDGHDEEFEDVTEAEGKHAWVCSAVS